MVPFAGHSMPVQFPTGILVEHQQVRSAAGLFDVSHMGQLSLIGPSFAETAAALEGLTPGNLSGLAPGRMRYTVLLNEEGGVIDDLMVTRPADEDAGGRVQLVVNADRRARDIAHLRERLPATIALDHHADRALLALQGPRAAEMMAAHVAGAEAFAFMSATACLFDGLACEVSRSGYTGEDGYEISMQEDHAVAMTEALLAHAAVLPIGLGARDSLRLEAGLCLYGHDLDETTSPVEADIEFTIAKRRREAGDFPGAARILAELRDGPSRKRIGLTLEGRAPARAGAEILDSEGVQIGVVTSGSFAPSLGVAIRDRHALCSPPILQETYLRSRTMSTRYTNDHEWVRIDGDTALIGISNYAQEQLGDIVFVELPEIGKFLKKGDEIAVVESVKAASEVYAPAGGEVVAANSALADDPEKVNAAAETDGWLIRVKLADATDLEPLMDGDAYRAFLATI